MRTILCVLLPRGGGGGSVPPAARWPAAALAAGQAAPAHVRIDDAGALYCDLPDTDTWATATSAARALLAQLRGAAGFVLDSSQAGLARHPFPAYCAATLARPGTLHLLPPGDEPAGLASLPLALLPGLPATRQRVLHTLRIFTLGDLAALPATALARVGGPDLLALQALVRGESPHRLGVYRYGADAAPACGPWFWAWAAVPVPPAPLTPAATLTALRAAAEALAARLGAAGQAAAALTLAVGFVHGPPATQRVPLAPFSDDGGALFMAAAPALARVLRAHRHRPAWVQLAAARWGAAVSQPALPALLSGAAPGPPVPPGATDPPRRVPGIRAEGGLGPAPQVPPLIGLPATA